MEVLSIFRVLVAIAALIVIVTTALPFSGSHAWWVRGWDFPRAQIAVAGAILALIALFIFNGTARWAVVGLLALCVGYQAYRILPYTFLGSKEMELVSRDRCGETIKLMAANVLMENDNFSGLIKQIEDFRPDVLLLMETNQKWIDALEETLTDYGTVLRRPQDNHYGLVFATRLEVEGHKVVNLTGDETPAVYAALKTPSGRQMRFVGLHPRPPVPGVDTEERDAEILFAARYAREKNVPLVAMGDFNDAAWSDTAQTFKRIGEYLDPRRGRGLYASFDARSWILRVPIDHFYHSVGVAVVDFKRGEEFGSDHFPITVTVCLDEAIAAEANRAPPPLKKDEREKADEIVAKRIDEIGDLLD